MTFDQKRKILVETLGLSNIEFGHIMKIRGLSDKIADAFLSKNKDLIDEIKALKQAKSEDKTPQQIKREERVKRGNLTQKRYKIQKVNSENGQIVEVYDSLKEACKKNDLNYSKMHIHIRKFRDQPINGFLYRKAEKNKKCKRCGKVQTTENTYFKLSINNVVYFRPECKNCESISRQEKAKSKINN